MDQPAPALSATQARQRSDEWLARLNACLTEGDAKTAASLFAAEGQWRDLVALTWTIETVLSRSDLADWLSRVIASHAPRDFHIDPARTPPRLVHRAGTAVIEAMFAFKTKFGSGSGVLRLDPDAGSPASAARTLSTTLVAITGHAEAIDDHRPTGPSDQRDFGAENWTDKRKKQIAYADHEPAVVIVGAGQAGLALAARLGALGVDTLVVEKNARVGDNWRKRYHSLTLHNEVFVNHLPYMPFPASWPVYIPKDKLANWLETYADALDINVWTGTTLVRGHYDDNAGHWQIELDRDRAGKRTLKPRHVVFATGASAIAQKAQLPGLDAFKGEVMHSERYLTGTPFAGKRAVVLGTGTSAHDVAQDLHSCGAHATIIQRSPTYIVSLREAQRVYATYAEGIPFDDCDLLATSQPFGMLQRSYRHATLAARNADKPLLDRLANSNFKLEFLDGDMGFQMRYMQRGGGYYFNVGCSDLIADGKVGVIQFDDIDTVVANGVRLKSGALEKADLVVLATGYLGQQDVVRRSFGDAIADRIGPVWGFDEGGELRNMWRRTPQKGLWFTAGSLAQCRIFSKFLAQQIKASELGLI